MLSYDNSKQLKNSSVIIFFSSYCFVIILLMNKKRKKTLEKLEQEFQVPTFLSQKSPE